MKPGIFLSTFVQLVILSTFALGQDYAPRLTIDAGKAKAKVSPTLYGLMTEEINYSFEGGLYGELIRNRIFRDNPHGPDHWFVVREAGATSAISLDEGEPISGTVLKTTLKLDASAASTGHPVGVANDGYWGFPVKPRQVYHCSFYAKCGSGTMGPLTVSIKSSDGQKVYAAAQVPQVTSSWQKYEVTLTADSGVISTADARFVISTETPGTLWFDLVSLFPPTFDDRPNGNRPDLMRLLRDMKPTFLRLPGGNFLEGDQLDERFPWKQTIGALEQRPGHRGCWHYGANDGMGLLELMECCEDLHIQPVLAVDAGYALNGQHANVGAELQPFVDEALDEIEFVTGDTTTKWGAERGRDGHAAPFPLTYVEIGNEDGYDKSGSYDDRFTQLYNAFNAKYPKLKFIATAGGQDRIGRRWKLTQCTPDAFDEHYYRTAGEMEADATHYDSYDRKGPKTFVGEWATREGDPTTNLNAALGDAAWMTGLERNSDLVVLASYAPLFVRVNDGGMQWKSDLIGFDTLTSYGSPSYYAQKMFSTHLGDEILAVDGTNIGTQSWQPPKLRDIPKPPIKPIPSLYYVATRDSATNVIYLKVVNISPMAQTIGIEVKGVKTVSPEGEVVTLTSSKPEDTNSIGEPTKIIPVHSKATGLGKSFGHTFPPYSVNVLQLDTR